MYNFEDDNPLNNTEGFSSSYYKELLDNSENRNAAYVKAMTTPEAVDADYEEIKDEPTPSKEDDPFMDEESDAKKLLNKGTSKGFDKQLDTLLTIKNGNQPFNSKEAAETFSQLFRDLNDRYGLNVRFDMDSFTNTLQYIIEPTNMKAMEIYLSESYSRIRVALYCQYLNSIALLSQQILSPQFINSNSMTYTDKLILMRELFNYIESLDKIYERVKVDQSDVKLRKLSEEHDKDADFTNDEVQKFLTALTSSIRDKDNKS